MNCVGQRKPIKAWMQMPPKDRTVHCSFWLILVVGVCLLASFSNIHSDEPPMSKSWHFGWPNQRRSTIAWVFPFVREKQPVLSRHTKPAESIRSQNHNRRMTSYKRVIIGFPDLLAREVVGH